MAITNAIMQVRRGLEADFDPEKMHPGEWSLSTDTKYIRMCIDPGTCLRMATYEAFEEDMERIEVIYADFKNAELDIVAAENSANLSKSYAVGGTGTRDNEDTDNAKYYSEKAKESADKLDTMTVDVLTNQLGEWTEGVLNRTNVINPSGVCFGGGKFVAVSNRIITSNDGVTWNEQTNDTGGSFNAVAYGKDKFVAVGNSVAYSVDGITWENGNGFVLDSKSNNLQSVCYGGGKFVAVGSGGICYYSEDGITWIANDIIVDARLTSVIYDGEKYISCGSKYILSSEDGVTWNIVSEGATMNMTSVACGNGKYFVIGDSVLYSTDGINWIIYTNSITSNKLQKIYFLNNQFIAKSYYLDESYYSHDFIQFSSDGENWSVEEKLLFPYNHITYGNHRYVQVYYNKVAYKEYIREKMNVKDAIIDLSSKVNRMPYALVPILSTKWTESTEYTGYGYEFVQAIEDYYDVFPEWFLKPLSGIVPTEAEQTAFENIVAMKLDISDTSSPKLKFYAATQPTTDILVLVKGVQ